VLTKLVDRFTILKRNYKRHSGYLSGLSLETGHMSRCAHLVFRRQVIMLVHIHRHEVNRSVGRAQSLQNGSKDFTRLTPAESVSAPNYGSRRDNCSLSCEVD
jgi:hypothetical protein